MAEKEISPKETAASYARGIAGGLLVAMPTFLTMEIWWGGFYLPAWRILLLMVANFAALLVLQHFSGLAPSETKVQEARDAMIAYAIGIVVATIALVALNIIRGGLALHDIAGKIALEAIPVSIGASVAMSEFGVDNKQSERRKKDESFYGVLGLAFAGAMLFGHGIAATEEPMIVGIQLRWIHALAIVILSLAQVHGIVYVVEFGRRERGPGGARWWQLMAREGISVYVVSLAVSAFLLWMFGYLGPDTALTPSLYTVVALGFVTSLGAAAGELLV
jgi:putative integral membrane protein (TIGR02587 family)